MDMDMTQIITPEMTALITSHITSPFSQTTTFQEDYTATRCTIAVIHRHNSRALYCPAAPPGYKSLGRQLPLSFGIAAITVRSLLWPLNNNSLKHPPESAGEKSKRPQNHTHSFRRRTQWCPPAVAEKGDQRCGRRRQRIFWTVENLPSPSSIWSLTWTEINDHLLGKRGDEGGGSRQINKEATTNDHEKAINDHTEATANLLLSSHWPNCYTPHSDQTNPRGYSPIVIHFGGFD